MNIGERIRQCREKAGLTQDELARKLGYKSRSSVNKVEKSRELSNKKVRDYANALGVTPAYLMGWEENVSHFSKKESLAEVCDKSKNDVLKFQGNQKEFHTIYQKLSSANQDRVLLYAKNLLSTQQMEDAVALNAAHDSGATSEQKQHADNIMEDPDEWT